jgi:hypothetical protein
MMSCYCHSVTQRERLREKIGLPDDCVAVHPLEYRVLTLVALVTGEDAELLNLWVNELRNWNKIE